MCKRIRKYIRKLIRSNRKTFKNKLCAIALLSLGTVSYTHLDVYKRQIQALEAAIQNSTV